MNGFPLTPDIREPVLPADLPPLLAVVVDTEEEFDWAAPFDRNSRSVKNIAEQHRAQAIFEEADVVPTYVIDYPVAATPESAAVFRDWVAAERCLVGAHLHPWVNPPDDEAVTAVNSYPGNLPADLEHAKLAHLRTTIRDNVGVTPTIYKAGRYGLGPNTAATLTDLGFEIDLSVVPATSFSADGGPVFHGYPHQPYWFGPDQRLFEIPLTRGYPGNLGALGPPVHRALSGPICERLHLPGILSRLGLVERIPLTPEGVTLEETKRLVRHLVSQGRSVFSLTYHSSSLLPGGSPYVYTAADRDRFLETIRDFLRFFRQEIGGRGATPIEIRALVS